MLGARKCLTTLITMAFRVRNTMDQSEQVERIHGPVVDCLQRAAIQGWRKVQFGVHGETGDKWISTI